MKPVLVKDLKVKGRIINTGKYLHDIRVWNNLLTSCWCIKKCNSRQATIFIELNVIIFYTLRCSYHVVYLGLLSLGNYNALQMWNSITAVFLQHFAVRNTKFAKMSFCVDCGKLMVFKYLADFFYFF